MQNLNSSYSSSSNASRKLWKTNRERERLKARHQVNERISSFIKDHSRLPNHRNNIQQSKRTISLTSINDKNPQYMKEISKCDLKPFFEAIEKGNASAFGICKLANLPINGFLDALHSPSFINKERVKLLCVSRFGPKFAKNILSYIDSLNLLNSDRLYQHNFPSGISLVTYAALLGQYQVLGSLLLGGANPIHPPINSIQEKEIMRYHSLSARVLSRFFDRFPITFKFGIVRTVVEMRVFGFIYLNELQQREKHEKQTISQFESESKEITDKRSKDVICHICNVKSSHILKWGDTCSHIFCEYCFWEDMINHIDERDSISCPVCGADRPIMNVPLPSNRNKISCVPSKNSLSSISSCNENIMNEIPNHPLDRCKDSFQKFNKLPSTTEVLKQVGQNLRKCPKNQIHFSWSDSVYLSLGRSQDVRREKFFSFVESNSVQYVKGCLEAGVHINDVNQEYNQSNLYIACWLGYDEIVKLLLHYGADMNILANGGMSCMNVAAENSHHEIVNILENHSLSLSSYLSEAVKEQSISPSIRLRDRFSSPSSSLKNPQTILLIDKSSKHPGAGAYYIDNALSDCNIQDLFELWSTLPIELGRKKGNEESCSQRSYICDSEGYLCQLIATQISSVNSTTDENRKHPIVLSHMRFLNYIHAGSSLPPHVDLCRFDRRYNQRSTHTFILYLTDCENGGETILLGGVNGDKRNEILAKIRPVKGRLLLFPHMCPHEGSIVQDVPKLLLRGEVMFVDQSENKIQ